MFYQLFFAVVKSVLRDGMHVNIKVENGKYLAVSEQNKKTMLVPFSMRDEFLITHNGEQPGKYSLTSIKTGLKLKVRDKSNGFLNFQPENKNVYNLVINSVVGGDKIILDSDSCMQAGEHEMFLAPCSDQSSSQIFTIVSPAVAEIIEVNHELLDNMIQPFVLKNSLSGGLLKRSTPDGVAVVTHDPNEAENLVFEKVNQLYLLNSKISQKTLDVVDYKTVTFSERRDLPSTKFVLKKRDAAEKNSVNYENWQIMLVDANKCLAMKEDQRLGLVDCTDEGSVFSLVPSSKIASLTNQNDSATNNVSDSKQPTETAQDKKEEQPEIKSSDPEPFDILSEKHIISMDLLGRDMNYVNLVNTAVSLYPTLGSEETALEFVYVRNRQNMKKALYEPNLKIFLSSSNNEFVDFSKTFPTENTDVELNRNNELRIMLGEKCLSYLSHLNRFKLVSCGPFASQTFVKHDYISYEPYQDFQENNGFNRDYMMMSNPSYNPRLISAY